MKNMFFAILLLAPSVLSAQNLQVHYDFGEDRKFITTTLEMFKPDTLGSTFWFVDFDFNYPGSPRSMSAAYWEISRDFFIPGLRNKPWFDQITFHIEYNDGFTSYQVSDSVMGAASYNSVFLTGFAHPLRIGRVELTTQWLCRIPRGMGVPDFQLTLVWAQSFLKNKMLFTGFMDLWSQDKFEHPDHKELVFLTEPQLWYFFNPHLACGSEIEISRNFPYGPHEWEFFPTLAFRWDF
jgi:hypothetical protein